MRIASGALATAFIGGAMYGVYKFERNSLRDDMSEPLPYVETTDTPIDAYNDQVVVPDVEGLTIDNAKDILNKAGIPYKFSVNPNSVNYGVVISQFPVSGEKINLGEAVEMIVGAEPSLDDIHTSRSAQLGFENVYDSGHLNSETVGGVTYTYGPNNVLDNNGKCWAENKSGVGKGAYIAFSSADALSVSGIGIWNGYDGTSDQFYNNGRVTKVRVTTDNDSFDFYLNANTMGEQYFGFGATVYTHNLTITILDAIKGDKYDDTCISEIVPYQ